MKAPSDIAARFEESWGYRPGEFYFSPGRVNFIGEHLDYNGGRVLPAAVSAGISAAVARNDSGLIRITSIGFPGSHTFNLQSDRTLSSAEWYSYPEAVYRRMAEKRPELLHNLGLDITLNSSLPAGAGLSSSAALEVLSAVIFDPAILNADGTQQRLLETAELCMQAEHDLGVNCGIMDQFSVALGKAGNLVELDTSSLQFSYHTMPADVVLVVMDTARERKLEETGYNDRIEQSRQLHQLFDIQSGESLAEKVSATIQGVDDPVLRKRLSHIKSEQLRVEHVCALLDDKQISDREKAHQLGLLLNESHHSLQADYEVSCHELDVVCDVARHTDGCYGARMTGAGFGGCALALVENRKTEAFIKEVSGQYTDRTGLTGRFFSVETSDGVHTVPRRGGYI